MPNDAPSRPRRRHQGRNLTKIVNVALQGGGAHGAFAWGVLDYLLEDGRLDICGISGASAGAVNAVVLAHGVSAGGGEGGGGPKGGGGPLGPPPFSFSGGGRPRQIPLKSSAPVAGTPERGRGEVRSAGPDDVLLDPPAWPVRRRSHLAVVASTRRRPERAARQTAARVA